MFVYCFFFLSLSHISHHLKTLSFSLLPLLLFFPFTKSSSICPHNHCCMNHLYWHFVCFMFESIFRLLCNDMISFLSLLSIQKMSYYIIFDPIAITMRLQAYHTEYIIAFPPLFSFDSCTFKIHTEYLFLFLFFFCEA